MYKKKIFSYFRVDVALDAVAMCQLPQHKSLVDPVFVNEFVVGSFLNDLTFVDDKNLSKGA